MAGVYWREAASLIIIKQKKIKTVITETVKSLIPNYEVLLLKRSEKSSFMANMHVFPGGAVSSSDLHGKWIKLLGVNGHSADEIKNRLQSKIRRLEIYENSSSIGELGFRICALRETFEETGLLIVKDREKEGCAKVISDKKLAEEWMPKIQKSPSQFLELFEHLGETPFIFGLHEWSSWLTPINWKIRFDTVFYIVFVGPEVSLFGHGRHHWESDGIQFACPADILSKFMQSKCPLVLPQVYELAKLLQITNFAELETFSKKRAHLGTDTWMSVLLQAKNGIIAVLPGDSLYPTDPDLFGTRNDELTLDKTIEEVQEMKKHNRSIIISLSLPAVLIVNIVLKHGQLRPIDMKLLIDGS